jgi:hypothetical protein
MGEFAEFCKGEQMGAFLPLLLPAWPAIRRLDQDQAERRLFGGLVKYDLVKGTRERHSHGQGRMGGEGVFVPRPQ